MENANNLVKTLSIAPTNTLLIMITLAAIALAAYAIYAVLTVSRQKDK